uniref:DM13 domain-containing protein n=1 Tax=Meloidogyne hapla TaxID=6305 RepID=A0A1I8B4R8_MELHA
MLRTSIQKSSKFSHLFTFLFNFSLFLLLRNALSDSLEVEEQGGDPYFGVPLGALHYSAEGTSAEVYAADEFTILFNHFQHNPRQPGCTAMIIGPPRPEDRENVIPGHGIILPMIKSNSFKAKREKREAIKFHRPQQFGGFWPIEFAHLLLEPSREGQEKSGSLNKESQEEKLKRNSTTSFSLPNSSTPDLQQKLSNNENTSTTSQTPTISSTTNTLNSNLNTSTHSSLIATTQPLILLGSKRTPTPLINQRNYSIAFLNAKDDAIVEDKIEKGIGSSIRRSPARNEYIGNNVIDIKPPIELTTTPLYQIIKDPRPGRRQRLIELRKKLDPTYEPPAFSTTSAPFSAQEIQYVLPAVRGQLATFTLTNGAKITQYKWIGLWNQCTKIMPLSGWSHNVTSYRLHILNCNTILIPSFHYDGRNTTKNTYFFVGVGQFPEAVEHQLKANIVGLRQGEPLRSYSGEDVVLRLPRPYRTFDIDFISIFNTDEQKSFGHVLIPSLLVPPC